MFKKLKEKWQVNWLQFALIFATFALGGSLCGFLGRKILAHFSIQFKPLWLVVYIIIVTILWPFCVLVVSAFTGQFTFFKNYLRKIGKRFTGK